MGCPNSGRWRVASSPMETAALPTASWTKTAWSADRHTRRSLARMCSVTGLGTMNLNIVGVGNMTYAFSIADAAGNGRIIQYQSGQGWAAGPLRRQDPNAFSLSSMAGTYSFGLTGISDKYQWSAAGEFAIDSSGNISNGLYDQSGSDGTYQNGSVAGL